MFSELAERIKRGERLAAGPVYEDIFEGGVLARFVAVDPLAYSEFLGYAQWFYETRADFPVLQLAWPDKAGRFP